MEKVDEMAGKIRKKYEYMDKMPPEGWLWEVIRRSPIYRVKMKMLAETKDNTARKRIVDEIKGLGVNITFIDPQLWRHEGGDYLIAPLRFEVRRAAVIPLPDTAYEKLDPKLPLVSLNPVNFLSGTYVDEQLEIADKKEAWNLLPSADPSGFWILGALTPTNAADTLYFGVSRIAPKTAIIERISKLLDEHNVRRSHSRMRTDKWKRYVIVYDLHKAERLTYSTIAEILDDICPKEGSKSHAENALQRDYSEAVKLIEKDGYKQYLYP
jgi:predicted RNA binding protein YcfA (HicA-like mRNA interferase family)